MVKEKKASFPRQERLRRRREFLKVYERGIKIPGSFCFFFVLKNGLEYSRLGLTVSRRVAKPVVRNRIKRRLREVFRTRKERISPSADIVINARRSAATAQFGELVQEFERAADTWRRQHQGES